MMFKPNGVFLADPAGLAGVLIVRRMNNLEAAIGTARSLLVKVPQSLSTSIAEPHYEGNRLLGYRSGFFSKD